MHFLLVDDDAADQEMFRRTLKSIRSDVCLTAIFTAGEAMQQLKHSHGRYEWIFFDQNLGISDGINLISTFREYCRLDNICLLSGHDPEYLKSFAEDHGVDFISHYMNKDGLREGLEGILNEL